MSRFSATSVTAPVLNPTSAGAAGESCQPPAHWPGGVVGGSTALLALEDEPLAPPAPSDDADEVHAEVADRGLITGNPGEVAGGLCWMAGRANGCVGAGTCSRRPVSNLTP